MAGTDPAHSASPDQAQAEELERRLRALGIDADTVRRAAQSGRLLQVAAERVLRDDARHSAEEIAGASGLDAAIFLAHMEALGRPRARPDETAFGEDDLEAARRIQAFRQMGLPDDRLLEQARIFRPALHHVAEAVLELVVDTALAEARSESELAVAMAELAEGLAPLAEPLLGYVLRLYVRQGLRQIVVGDAALEAGRLPQTQEVTVCFADLTGFTELGEASDPAELTRVTNRFAELAVGATGSEVRLVKLLGDAAMLVSPDTGAVLEAARKLVEAAIRESGDFPRVHAGLAHGPAVPRGGDWYGSTVNRASRIAGVAGADQVVADRPVRDAAGGGWRALGHRELKGLRGAVELFVLEPARPGS